MTMEYLISDLRSSIPILKKIADGQILSFDEAWSLVTIYKRYRNSSAFVDYVEDTPKSEYAELQAQLQESVDAPAADHPNNTTKRYMKKGRSFTPLNCALNPLIFELRDSADALVDLLTK